MLCGRCGTPVRLFCRACESAPTAPSPAPVLPHPCGCPHLRAGDVCAAHEAARFQAGNLERIGRMSGEQRAHLGDFAHQIDAMAFYATYDPGGLRMREELARAIFARFVEASR